MHNVGESDKNSFQNTKINTLSKEDLVQKLLQLETNSEEKARNLVQNLNEEVTVSEALNLFSNKLRAISNLMMYESNTNEENQKASYLFNDDDSVNENNDQQKVTSSNVSLSEEIKLNKDQMQLLHDNGEVEVDGYIIKFEESNEVTYKPSSIKESFERQIDENVWPKANLSVEYQRKLEQALEQNFDEDYYFYVVDHDLYVENQKLMDNPEEPILTINPEDEEPMDVVEMVEKHLDNDGLHIDEAKKGKKKGKSIAKIQKEWAKITDKMKEKAEEYKQASDKDKEKIKKELKELTNQKKELENELNKSVQQKDADIDLETSESKKSNITNVETLVKEYLQDNNETINEMIDNNKWSNIIDQIMENKEIEDSVDNRKKVRKTLINNC